MQFSEQSIIADSRFKSNKVMVPGISENASDGIHHPSLKRVPDCSAISNTKLSADSLKIRKTKDWSNEH